MKITRAQVGIIFVAVLISCTILMWTFYPRPEVDVYEGYSKAPDGRPYDILLPNGQFLFENLYNLDFGHASELANQLFADYAPEYLLHLDFASLRFPDLHQSAYYFPAVMLYITKDYAWVPEDVLYKYLPIDEAALHIALRNGEYADDQRDDPMYIGEGEDIRYEPDVDYLYSFYANSPVFLHVNMENIAYRKYRVTYVLDHGGAMPQTLIRYFTMDDIGISKISAEE